MKAILEFELNSIENNEENEFYLACNANQYYSALYSLKGYLRDKLKYSELSQDTENAYEHIMEKISELTDGLRIDI